MRFYDREKKLQELLRIREMAYKDMRHYGVDMRLLTLEEM